MYKIFKALLKIGSSADLNSFENNRIQMINYISIYISLSNIIFSVMLAQSNHSYYAMLLLLSSIPFALLLLLHYSKTKLPTSTLLFLFIYLEIAINSFAESGNGFTKYYLFPVSLLPFVIMNGIKERLFFFFSTILFFFFVHFTQPYITPTVPYDPFNFSLDAIVAFMGMFLVIDIFIKQHNADIKTINCQNTKLNNQVEELNELNASKTKLLSIVSHDLKNPLQNILQLLKIFESKELDEIELRKYSQNLHNAIKEQFDSIENLLKWSQLQLKGIKTNAIKFDIVELMENIIRNNQLKLTEKQLQVVNNFSGKLFVFADIDQVEIILKNIFDNAIKFSPLSGQITVGIKMETNKILLTINDSGNGFEDKIKNELFEFSKIQSTYGTNNEKGTGLGLLLSKELADQNSILLEIHSDEKSGSSISLAIPIS